MIHGDEVRLFFEVLFFFLCAVVEINGGQFKQNFCMKKTCAGDRDKNWNSDH